MTDTPELGPNDLLLVRKLKAPRNLIWRCWTTPDLLMQWFCPRPWMVSKCTIDLRPGGVFFTHMRGPDEGQEHPNYGLYLEVVPETRLVFTDALTEGWRPAETPFMTAIVEFSDLPEGGTLSTSRALHRNAEDRERHVAMGFEAGWGAAAVQLDELALSLM